MPIPPLCEMSATRPASGRERANVALSRGPATPRQFGPIMRMPADAAVCGEPLAAATVPRRPRSRPRRRAGPRRPWRRTRARPPRPASAGHRHDGELDRLVDVEDRLPAADREDGPVEALAHVREQRGADRARPRAGADDRDRRGREEVRDRGHRADRARARRTRRSASGPRAVGSSTPSSPGCAWTSTGKPLSRNTSIIAWFSGSTSAVNVSMPSAAARSAAAPSRIVPTPRPCQASATSKATSARPSPSRT